MHRVNLSIFSPDNFNKGAGCSKQIIWYFVNALFVRASWNPFMGIKITLLKLFGARIGKGLIIKNNITVKFPWKLTVGNHVWLGESCWIDNLDHVTIGNNVCISQGALILTGNHDYTISSMPYRNAPITLEDGVWIGAKSVVCPGVICYSHSILTAGSVATKNMEMSTVYQGNPAIAIRKRVIK
ncbi:MAG: WcaF family extracellular polysaccharide biosynthesis acetyltransferase [Dysgonamonadaceae bacterium]|jgi:putative colanic acid biosynthesis acetyltransferase WcaF|nr:WcaF family extracellular polysaccharide biosynthesis acetyltransferase [Dysgonamonadaceae bacterium]